jgi:hypothetical protein
MSIGLISITILLAFGACGLGLFTIRSARFDINPSRIVSIFDISLTALTAVLAIACGIGAVHFFQQIGG